MSNLHLDLNLEQVAVSRLGELRGNISANRANVVQISPQNDICIISDAMINIYHTPICAGASGKWTLLRYETAKKDILQVRGSSGSIFSKMFGFSCARWSPLGNEWKGSLLAVCTMQGNLLVYVCEQSKETSQEWKLMWEWAESEGFFIHDLQWNISSMGKLNMLVSFRSIGCRLFALIDGMFVMEQIRPVPTFLSFCFVEGLIFGIDAERIVWFNNERLFSCQELCYFIKVLLPNCIALCGSTEVILWSSGKRTNISYGRLIQPIDCELVNENLVLYSSENEAWIISLETQQMQPFVAYAKSLACTLESSETSEKCELVASVPGTKSFSTIGSCGSIEKVKFVVVAKVSVHGFRSCSIISLVCKDANFIGNDFHINAIYKATLVPERKSYFIEEFCASPKSLFLFGTLVKDSIVVKEAKRLLNRPQRQDSIYDVCEWSGEELKSPFNLVCSMCCAKYKLTAPVLNCLLCGGPVYRSKFCPPQ